MARCLRPAIGREELRDLVGAEDDGELLRLLGADDAVQDPLLAEGDLVEEPQGGEGLVVIAPGDVLLLDEEEEVGADVGRPQALGRLAEVLGEGGDALDVDLDGPGAKLRSFMSSIIRWRSGVMACSSDGSGRGRRLAENQVCGHVPYLRHSSESRNRRRRGG